MSVWRARINSSSNLSPSADDIHSDQTFEEIFKLLDVTIKNLLKQTDYTNLDAFRDLKLVQKQTRYADDVLLHHHVVDKIVHAGIGHVFLRSWQQLSSKDYFSDVRDITNININNTTDSTTDSSANRPSSEDDYDQHDGADDRESEESKADEIFRNFQYVLSIVWNCTDSSVQLCESLIRSSVVYEMLSQLSKPSLTDSRHYSMEESNQSDKAAYKRVYLMKAYLGILHNIARHCPGSRKMFRSAGALQHLKALVRFPQEVVRAKTYLTLSYIVSGDDDDNDVLEAADDIASFIVAILREALGSVNHFVVRYAFWASEIACGINHLAINDANKVRLGKLGVIQLYASMLLNGDDEEKSLASSGIWILSFHLENKKIIRSDLALVKTLTQVASRCTLESVSRSLRGALWVARSNPGSLLEGEETCFYGDNEEDDDDDPTQEHVMISYHWSSQKMMIKVRDALYGRGYKVWFDVDNMRGSTLEAMALAVERSAVILICMSQSYKESPNCRTEAEYAFKMRKDVIPVITQSRFAPDGWLGMLAGTKLYFDFSPSALRHDESAMTSSFSSDTSTDEIPNSEIFNHQMDRLIREIGNRGRKMRRSHGNGRSGGNNNVNGSSMMVVDGGGSASEECIVEMKRHPLHALSQLENSQASTKNASPGKIQMDSGVSSAEVMSSIINQEGPRCHKCGAVAMGEGVLYQRLPTFSISSSTPEFEETNVPKLLTSPTPLHTYRKESTSSCVKREVKYWSSEQVDTWIRSLGLENHSHLFSGFEGQDLLSLQRLMKTAPEFFYSNLKDSRMELIWILRLSEALEKI